MLRAQPERAFRRAAAAYGDADRLLSEARTHGCLPSLVGEADCPEGIYVEFEYVTMEPSPQPPPLGNRL